MRYLIDPHTHSVASGHGQPAMIYQMAAQAEKMGLSVLCVTDHGPATPGSASLSYFRSLSLAPHIRSHVHILYGCEVNILSLQGEVDLPDDILSGLDFVIASLHTANVRPGTAMQNTDALIRVMQHPHIHMIGHPDDARFPLDFPRLVREAAASRTLLELNEASLSPQSYRKGAIEMDLEMLACCAQTNCPVLFGSDAHGIGQIAHFDACRKLAQDIGFPEELIQNDKTDRFLELLVK